MKRFACRLVAGLAVAFGLVASVPASAEPTLEFIYEYPESASGIDAQGTLAVAPDGTVYLASRSFGSYGRGAVMSLTPPAAPGGPYTVKEIHAFNEYEGGWRPGAGVTLGPDGAVYGTTLEGGVDNKGVVFKLTPPTRAGAPWKKQILVQFGRVGAGYPLAELMLENGVLYGTTTEGGESSFCGTAFSLTPTPTGVGPWSYRRLIGFTFNFGCSPRTKLTRGPDGALYGTLYNSSSEGGGAIYRLSPRPTGPYLLTRLKTFTRYSSPNYPFGDIAFDGSGAIIGGLFSEGRYGGGALYKLAPPRTGQTKWTLSYIKVFPGGDRAGSRPAGVAIRNGVIAVATRWGGPGDAGTVMTFTPTPSGPKPYEQKLVATFPRTHRSPQGAPAYGPSGEFYGANEGRGAVWKVTP